MNYTPLEDAYKINHVHSNTYSGTLKYHFACIYCNHPSSKPLMPNDGGSFRQCDRCKKNFRAIILNQAVNNFSYSTNHLKGTN
jgi:transcription elongation factor Elf1